MHFTDSFAHLVWLFADALGRFDRLLDVQLPNEADRADIFQIHTRCIPRGPDVDLKELARLTEGYTGADIKLVCREAAVAALDVCYSSFPTLVVRAFASSLMVVGVCWQTPLFSFQQESFHIEEVSMRHFEFAISKVLPSDVKFYQKLAEEFRRFVDGPTQGML